MTTFLPQPTSDPLDTTGIPDASGTAVTWRRADDQVYVATIDGEYAGFVDATGQTHEAHGPLGESLGSYPTLLDAEEAVTASVRQVDVASRNRRILRARPRRRERA